MKIYYPRHVKGFLADGRTPYERRFAEPFKGSVIPLNIIFAEDQSRLHQFGQKVLLGIFLGYALCLVGIWKGDVPVADLEELETMDASEIYSKNTQCERGDNSQRKGEFRGMSLLLAECPRFPGRWEKHRMKGGWFGEPFKGLDFFRGNC